VKCTYFLPQNYVRNRAGKRQKTHFSAVFEGTSGQQPPSPDGSYRLQTATASHLRLDVAAETANIKNDHAKTGTKPDLKQEFARKLPH
jgi:hypothetical protein